MEPIWGITPELQKEILINQESRICRVSP